MTLDEITDSLPNGFHDAQINSISINYVKREATFDLEIWVAESSQGDSDVYRSAQLKLLQFLFLAIEPPNPRYDYHEEKPLWVAGSEGQRHISSTQLPSPLPEGAFTYWFFVHDWNSFIHIAALDAEILLR